MDLLDDDGLTNGTLTLSNARDGTLVVACGAIAREILAINEFLSWDNISIKCLPAIYHNHPEKITPAVIDVVKNNKQKYQLNFPLLQIYCKLSFYSFHLLEVCTLLTLKMNTHELIHGEVCHLSIQM